jgi:hypothetical protein
MFLKVAFPGNLLEMQILASTPDPLNLEFWEWALQQVFKNPPGNKCLLKFKNHRSNLLLHGCKLLLVAAPDVYN